MLPMINENSFPLMLHVISWHDDDEDYDEYAFHDAFDYVLTKHWLFKRVKYNDENNYNTNTTNKTLTLKIG